MCQGVTKSGKACRSKVEPFCKQHEPVVPLSNAAAFAELAGATPNASPVLVQLGATLAADMDSGESVRCPKCKEPVGVARNAALVKQYREVVEVLIAEAAAEDEPESPALTVLAQIRDAGKAGAA